MPFLELDDETKEIMADTTVGSGSQAAWRIANKDLAARHFTVQVGGGTTRIVPASDRSVVVVNGKQLGPGGAQLSNGDVIAAGSARFLFLSDRDAARPAAAAARAGEFYLYDPSSRQAYHLRKRSVPIGRDAQGGILLRDPTVSRHHADVRAEAGGYVLYSSGTAGTQLNDASLTAPRLLTEGDRITIGGTTLTLTHTLPPGAKVVEPAEAADDAISSRSTIVEQEAVAVTGRQPTIRRSGVNPVLIAVIVVLVLVIVYFVLVRR